MEIDIAKIASQAREDAARAANLEATINILRNSITPQTFKVEVELRCIGEGYKAAAEIEAYIHSIWPAIQTEVYARSQKELIEIVQRYEVFERANKPL